MTAIGHAKLYGLCPRKQEARRLSIIEVYRKQTGLHSIPPSQQYWTLCGNMSDGQGGLQPACELKQLLEEGLLRPQQFHGVERKEEPYHETARALKASFRKGGPRLYLGEVADVMSQALMAGKLRPAIVNLDTLYEPLRAVKLLGSILDILNRTDDDVLVVLNVILKNRGNRYSFEDVVREATQDRFCQRQLDQGWMESVRGFEYNGTGHSRSIMGTTLYFRPGRAVSRAG